MRERLFIESAYAEIPGVTVGSSFHTALGLQRDLRGKRVGIIGTGAGPSHYLIVDDVDTLTFFNALPLGRYRDDEPTPPEIVDAFKTGGYSEKLRHVIGRATHHRT